MDTWSVSRCRYFRGLKLLINHELTKSTKQKPILLNGLRVLCVLRGYFRVIARILRMRRAHRGDARELRREMEGSGDQNGWGLQSQPVARASSIDAATE